MRKVLFVCSGGGHFLELLQIHSAFDGMEKNIVLYKENTDIPKGVFNKIYSVSNPFSIRGFCSVAFNTFRILLKERPDVLISSGSEITIPFFYIGKLLGIKLIYMEGVAQVYSASVTGKLISPIADLFLVQWKYLTDKYPRKATYVGGLL